MREPEHLGGVAKGEMRLAHKGAGRGCLRLGRLGRRVVGVVAGLFCFEERPHDRCRQFGPAEGDPPSDRLDIDAEMSI